MSLFCRHNRFLADCPICSKGTALDRSSRPARRPRRSAGRPREAAAPPAYTGPYAAIGPYEDEEVRYEVRLERVPGGLRLAEWAGGRIRRRAPVLAAADLPGLIAGAQERELLPEELGAAPDEQAEFGASPGRAGELRDELRVEALGEGRVRIGRWVMRPNFGWELQEAPVMLPAARYVEALAASGLAGSARP